MADAASPAPRPAGRCQLLHPPRWRASRRGSTLTAKRDCRSSGQIVTAGPSSRVLEPTFPPALQAGAVLTCVSLSTAPGSPFCS